MIHMTNKKELHPGRSRALRLFRWSAGLFVVLGFLCSSAILYLLNTSAGHLYLLGLARRQAAQALGVDLQLQNFALHPSRLSVDLYGIRVSKSSSQPEPLVEADRVHVSLHVVSILEGSWQFQTLQVDHPVFRVEIDDSGRSNLPAIRKGTSSHHADIFDLGIRHFQITRGELYLNSRPSAIVADLHDLRFRSEFSEAHAAYRGSLGYSNGQLTIANFRPIEHGLEMEFDARRELFRVTHASLAVGDSRAFVSATVSDFSHPAVQAQYQITIDGKQIARILGEPALPSGLLKTSGTLTYQQVDGQNPLESLGVQGELSSPELIVTTAGGRIGVSRLAGGYSLRNGDAVLRGVRGEVLGGTIAGEGAMRRIGSNSRSELQASLQNISLAEAQDSLVRSPIGNRVKLDGTVNAVLRATWGRTAQDLVAYGDMNLNGDALRPETGAIGGERIALSADSPVIPLRGAVHGVYDRAKESLTLQDTRLRSPQTTLDLNGTVSRDSSLSLRAQTSDLREIASLMTLFGAQTAGASLRSLGGRAVFEGSIRGSIASPGLAGRLTAENLEYDGSRWKYLQTSIAASPSHAKLDRLRLQAEDRGTVTANAELGLQRWVPEDGSPVLLDLDIANVAVQSICAPIRSGLPITGTLNAHARVRGSFDNPRGSASATISRAVFRGEPVSRARIDLSGSGGPLTIAVLLQLPAGTAQAHATADLRARTFTAQLEPAEFDLTKIQTLTARGVNAKGSLRVQAHGQGKLDAPEISADLEIPEAVVGNQSISQTRLRIDTANHFATLDLATSVSGASLRGKARVDLSGANITDASLDSQKFPLRPIIAALAPEMGGGVTGEAEIHATLHGPLRDARQMEVHMAIPTLSVDYENSIQLAASPIRADLLNGAFVLQPATIRGTDTQLNLQGAFPVRGNSQASFKAQGAINLAILRIFNPDLRASGQAKVDIDSKGAIGSGFLNGRVEIAGGSLSTNAIPAGIENASATLKLANDRMEIEAFKGTVGGGPVDAQGAVVIWPRPRFDVGMTAKEARLLYPQGVRENVNANLRLTGSINHALLSGSVNLADLSFTPAFDLSNIIRQFSGGVEAPPSTGFAQNLDLNIAVNSPSNANLVSRTLSVAGSANLQLRGTAAEPVILGRVSLDSGDVILNGNRFVLTGGTIQFINPTMTEPLLNVSLSTSIQEYKIDLRFQGPSDRMRTQYSSDPSLPQADIINLLASGQTSEASAMNQSSMNQQAEGLVASQVSSQVTSRISRAAGISQLSISPVLAGGTYAGPPGANITIRQRVTGNLFVTFSTNVATTQGQTIQGQYQVSPRVALSATRDPNGGFAMDAIIKKSW